MAIAAAVGYGADKKKLVISDPSAGNERIDITASVLLEPEEIHNALGMDLPKGVIAIKVRVKPVADPIRIDLDDFQIVSHKDGQRSGPYSPTQLIGGPALVIRTETTSVGTGPMTRNTGPVWGGVPGTMGRPQQLPGSGSAVGSGGESGVTANSGVGSAGDSGAAKKKQDDPMLAALKEKGLKPEEIKEPTVGLLYFPLEGKHKPKDVSLVYKGVGGRLVLTFGK